jgi:hypothetical protein
MASIETADFISLTPVEAVVLPKILSHFVVDWCETSGRVYFAQGRLSLPKARAAAKTYMVIPLG